MIWEGRILKQREDDDDNVTKVWRSTAGPRTKSSNVLDNVLVWIRLVAFGMTWLGLDGMMEFP